MKVIKLLEDTWMLSKRTIRKITSQKWGFLNFLRPFMTAGLPLMKSVITPFAKSILFPNRIISSNVSNRCSNSKKKKKNYGSGITTLIISNEEMEDIMKTVKLLEESGLLVKGISETIKNETKEQKGEFLIMLFGTLPASI